MPDDSAVPNSPQEDLPRTRSENFALIYANWAQGAMSPWDITLAFAHVAHAEPEKTAIIEQAHVVMAPAFAKALVGTLAGAVKEYERQNGEIPIPTAIKERAKIRASLSPSASPSPSASVSPSASASPSEESPADE